MKIKINDLGPVRNAEFKLNKLNILVGDNNAGKTYITYSIYELLKQRIESFAHFWRSRVIEILKYNIDYFEAKNRVSDNITIDFRIDEYNVDFNNQRGKRQEIQKTNDLSNRKRSVAWFVSDLFNDSNKDILTDKTNISLEAEIEDILIPTNESQSQLRIKTVDDIIHCIIDVKSLAKKTALRDSLAQSYLMITNILQPQLLIQDVNIFTAERLGISIFYKELDAARNNLIQELQAHLNGNQEQNTSSFLRRTSAFYARPIKDNIDYTRLIENNSILKANIDNTYILEIFSLLIGGTYVKAANEEIRYFSSDLNNPINIPLHLTSSSVRALSDLFFYVKHLAKKGDMLMIDEPESHLTLEKQRVMARLIAAIINQDVSIWITTHSDFLLREINNLILLNNEFPEKEGFLKNHTEDYTIKDKLKYTEVSLFNLSAGILTTDKTTKDGFSDSFLDIALVKSAQITAELQYYQNNETE